MVCRHWLPVVLAVSLISGCGDAPSDVAPDDAVSEVGVPENRKVSGPAETAAPAGQSGEGADGFQLGDLVEPFTPPPLAELDRTAEWVDQSVEDSMELLRRRLEGEKPLATVEEALQLQNRTSDDNAKIVSALGRLPENDAQADWEATINRHTAGDVKSTNPVLASSTTEFDIGSLVGFGLFSFDWAFRPFAARESVVSWQSSKDRLMDKVVMRDDLTWSDGTPITAHDVAFSFRLIMSSKVPVPAQRSGTDKLKWVEAYDDHTVVFFHKESLATNIWNVNFSIVPRHIYEQTVAADPTLVDSAEHVKLEDAPVSGGPYVFTKRIRGQEIVLQRRDGWHQHKGVEVREKPFFRTVRFVIKQDPSTALLALMAGDIDEFAMTPEQWETQTNGRDFYQKNTKSFGLEWVAFHFAWNCNTPWFSDARVRRAMSFAFDHQELLEKLRYGLDEPCNGIFHGTSPWSPKQPPKPYQRDLDQAEKLLDEADWTDHDGDGIRDREINGKTVRFEFTILTSNRQDRIDVCNLLRQNLGEIGIECNVKPLEFAVLQDSMQKKEFHAAFGGWGTGTDPDTSENIWGTNQERNYGSYSNPEVDRLFTAGRREFDFEKRREIYGQIHQTLWDDQPYTWLYYRNSYYAFSKQLRGYIYSPRGPYHYGPGFFSIWKPAQH